MIDYLPNHIKDFREYIAMMSALQPEFDLIWEKVDYALQEVIIMTATDYGLTRWEEMLKISPMATDTLEDRRFRILSLLFAKLPYTYRQLHNLLTELCGAGNYMVDLQPDNYYIMVMLSFVAASRYQAMTQLLEKVIPVNLILEHGVILEMRSAAYIGGVSSIGTELTIYPVIADTEALVEADINTAGSISVGSELTIRPLTKNTTVELSADICTGGVITSGTAVTIRPNIKDAEIPAAPDIRNGGSIVTGAELTIYPVTADMEVEKSVQIKTAGTVIAGQEITITPK